MHEYGLMEDIVAHAAEAARGANGPVTLVRVEVGELAGASLEALETAFQALVPGTVLAGARLEMAVIPGELRCDTCGFRGTGQDLGVDPNPPWLCPSCGDRMAAERGKDVVLADVSTERIVNR